MTGVSLPMFLSFLRVFYDSHSNGRGLTCSKDHWGAADVQAAVAEIPKWILNVDWDGPDVAVDDWILVGHSNGGNGSSDLFKGFL